MARAIRRCGASIFLCLAASFLVNTQGYALDKKTSYSLSHYIMGGVYDNLGDMGRAIKEYKQALKTDYSNSVIHLNLAYSYIKINQIQNAIDELGLAIKFNPQAVEPHAILALLYSAQDKNELASSEYESALKNASRLQPQNPDIYKSLGAIYLQQKKFKEAEVSYRLVLNLTPDDPEAHLYLANIYDQLKDTQKAEEELKKALLVKPDYHQALNFLGYLYVEGDKNFDQAEAMIKKAMELSPDNGAYIDSLGWLYFKKGKIKEALKELEQASLLMADPVIYDHLGDVYFKTEERDKAKLNWEKSLKLDPSREKVKQKLGDLKNVELSSPN